MPTDVAMPSLFPEGRRVKVLLPLPLAGAYDYLAPDGLEVAPGSLVLSAKACSFLIDACQQQHTPR